MASENMDMVRINVERMPDWLMNRVADWTTWDVTDLLVESSKMLRARIQMDDPTPTFIMECEAIEHVYQIKAAVEKANRARRDMNDWLEGLK